MKKNLLWLFKMSSKIAFYGLLTQAFFITVLHAHDGAAQKNVKSVKETNISLNLNDATVEDVFQAVEQRSDFVFFYDRSEIDKKVKLNIRLREAYISDVLLQLSRHANLKFRQVNQIINVSRIESTDNANKYLEIVLQTSVVSGKVTAEDSPGGLPGVNILLKGSSAGVVTDVSGNYSIEVPGPQSTLIFSSVGYATQEIVVGDRSVIDVTLAQDVQALEEIVVIGYGTAKKSDVTGAIISVNEEQLRSRPVSNAFEAMQGKAAGVDITSNERPGEIGQIFVRGVRSLTASNTPLYVVDGIPLMSSSGIETLNPADIESIDVLKDASATAIYGSRGANGVILVTTKRGRSGEMDINYSGTVTFETIQDRTQMMNAAEYLTWRRWAYYYADPNQYPRGDQPTQANDYQIFLGANDPHAWDNIMQGWEGGTWDGSKVETTDWTGMVTQTGVTNEHNLSVSGGSEKIKAYGSFGYLDNEGTMKGQRYTRYTSKVSVDLIPAEWFEMGLSVNATFSDQQYGQSNVGGQVSGPGSIYAAANALFPYAVPYDNNGVRITYPGGDDLVKTAVDEWKYTDNERKLFRAIGSIYAQVNLLPGLRYRLNFGPDFRNFKNGVFIDEMSVNRVGSPNMASLRNQNDFSWTLDNLIYYDKTIDRHNFGVTLLQTVSAWNANSSFMRAIDIPLPSQKWNALNKSNIPALDDWDSNLTERELMSYMARVNYGLADKYLLTLSGRWDGASQLAEGHKWEFFPSAAIAWRIDQEGWMQNTGWISQLKVRLGVGTTGNSAIDPYQTKARLVSLFYPFGGVGAPGFSPYESQVANGELPMANHGLRWEKTTQYNLGVDFSVFNDRVYGVIDVYTSRTKDLLMEMSIPPLTGYTRTYANIGETKNRGIDITLNTINVRSTDFTWQTSLNAAWQKDEIVSLANGKEDDILNTWFIGQPIGITVNGDPRPGVIYGYESNGLWQEEDQEEMDKFNANGHSFQPGKSRPVDQNGDYRIDPNDDRVIIGHTRPRWTVGMTNGVSYKNFDFSFFLYGRLGYTYNTNGEWQGGRYVQRKIDYYNENNKNAEYQKPIYNVAGGDPYHTILGYRSGSFIKIRNVSLGYTFPQSLTNRLGLENLKLYVQVKNPGMLYSKIDWLDLDLGGSTWNRGYVVGLNVGL